MKKKGNLTIVSCLSCLDREYNTIEHKCRKFGYSSKSIDDLFEKCRLPELKEIRVWFEKRPENADIMDVCAYCNEFGTWEIDIKIFSQDVEWVQLTAFIRKIDAESFLGCKIPEEVKP